MKKLLALLLVFTVVLSFAACGGSGGSGASDPELIGTWVVDHTETNTTEQSLKATFEHVSELVYFPGAKMEFKTNGDCTLNNEVVSYKITGDGKFETLNAQNQRTEVKYTIENNTLKLSMYSDGYIVVLTKGGTSQSGATQGNTPSEVTKPNSEMTPNTVQEKVEETKAKIEETKKKIEETKQKIEETKEIIEEAKEKFQENDISKDVEFETLTPSEVVKPKSEA